MRKLVHLFLALTFIGATASSADSGERQPVRQVFLLQNSGWMEPFYQDRNSPLRPFANRLIGQAARGGGNVVVASFNQNGQVKGRKSPEVLFEGGYDPDRVREAIDRIDLPRKASGAYADADFRGALFGTLADILHGDQSIIWLITNNKDAPDNNPAVRENTRAFYDALRSSPHITAIAAFPMRRLVQGEHYSERGLIVYAIAYGDRARGALREMLRDGSPVRSQFPAPPVRLKPLDDEPVELLLDSKTADVGARVHGGRLYIRDAPASGATVRLQGRLRNRYYPQNIARARLSAAWRSGSPELARAVIRMQPAEIVDVPANAMSGPVRMEIDLPKIPRPPGLSGLFADERVVQGELEVRLDSIDFSLDRDFLSRISAISGGDTIQAEQAERAMAANLPEVFLDYRRISSASMRVPVLIKVRYSAWPLILAIAGLALLILAAIGLAIVMGRAREYRVRVGQSEHRIRIKPRERRTLADPLGNRAEVVGRLFGAPSVRPLEGAST
jgi:hypothetical protein